MKEALIWAAVVMAIALPMAVLFHSCGETAKACINAGHCWKGANGDCVSCAEPKHD